MKIDYSYHYKKWNSDNPESSRLAIANYSQLYGEHFITDKAARCLDVGCGSGYALETLRALGFQNSFGIDIDSSQIESCRKKGLQVELVEDSRLYLAQHPGSFEQIIAFDLIEHIPQDEQLEFVAALAGALAPTGRLLCTTPNANSFVGMRYRYIDWTHHSSFTEHSLDFLLYAGGFRNIRILPAEKVVRPKWWFAPTRSARFYWAWRFFRAWRRLQFMVEIGPNAGRLVPLSANLFGIAFRN